MKIEEVMREKLNIPNVDDLLRAIPIRKKDRPTKTDMKEASVIAACVSNWAIELIYENRKRIAYTVITRSFNNEYTLSMREAKYINKDKWIGDRLLLPIQEIGIATSPASQTFSFASIEMLDEYVESVTDPATHSAVYYNEEAHKKAAKKVFGGNSLPAGYYLPKLGISRRAVSFTMKEMDLMNQDTIEAAFRQIMETLGKPMSDIIDNAEAVAEELRKNYDVAGTVLDPVDKYFLAGQSRSGGLMELSRDWTDKFWETKKVTGKEPVKMTPWRSIEVFDYLLDSPGGDRVVRFDIYSHGHETWQHQYGTVSLTVAEYTCEEFEEGAAAKLSEVAKRETLMNGLAGRSDYNYKQMNLYVDHQYHGNHCRKFIVKE